MALFVVATPIGHLEDITLRALETLKRVDLVIAEDTRSYRVLAQRHGLPARRVYSLYKGNEPGRVKQVLPWLIGGMSAALVSENGTPALSDPGALLIQACVDQRIPIVPVPGPSALTAALSVCPHARLPVTFLGFLPKRAADRVKALTPCLSAAGTAVFFENPGRLAASLACVAATFPRARVTVCRELTKLHEEIWSGDAAGARDEFGSRRVKGEVTVLVWSELAAPPADLEAVDAQICAGLDRGMSVKEVSAETAARLSISKNEAYRRALDLQRRRKNNEIA